MADGKVVAVAVIGLLGTLGAAVIGNWDKIFPGPPRPSPSTGSNDTGQPHVAPPAVKRSTGSMGPLEEGISYNQGDLYDRPSSSAQECTQLCYNDDRCVAVTFIKSQQRCWIKSSLGPIGRSSDMVSSRKVAR